MWKNMFRGHVYDRLSHLGSGVTGNCVLRFEVDGVA